MGWSGTARCVGDGVPERRILVLQDLCAYSGGYQHESSKYFSQRNATSLGARLATSWLGLTVFLMVAPVVGRAAVAAPDVLANLRQGHPRLLITKDDLVGLRAASATNLITARVLTQAESAARKLLSQPPLTYRRKASDCCPCLGKHSAG